MNPPRPRRTFRLVAVVLIMTDTLRRIIGGDVRPVDVWVIVIEVLVLLWIVFDSTWDKVDRFRTWRERKRDERETLTKLNALGPDERAAVRDVALHGKAPPDQLVPYLLGKLPYIIRRDFIAWHIPDEHKRLVTRWAKKQ